MTVTKHFPLSAAMSWYGGTTLDWRVVLLKDTLTSWPPEDSVSSYSDVSVYEIDSQGGYNRSSNGLTMNSDGVVAFTTNSTAGVIEFNPVGVPASAGVGTWKSDATISVTGFRWAVIILNGYGIIAALDCGAGSSVDNDQLTLTIPQSTVSTGIYPIVTYTRDLT